MIPRVSISAIIITRNEEKRLKQCLEGVWWVDEVLVVDNGSTDNTLSIAKKLHAKVIVGKERNFSNIRNSGAQRARGEWLLYVDADEIVTPALRNEIQLIIQNPNSYNAYVIPRKNYYLGQLWPSKDGMVRLIRKNALIRWEGVLHEHAVVRGETSTIHNYFIHDTHRTLEEMVAKTNEWSAYEATLRFDTNHPVVSWWRILRVMCTAFYDSFIKQGGWRAGTIGWIESIYQAFSIFITYAKLWEMQQKSI